VQVRHPVTAKQLPIGSMIDALPIDKKSHKLTAVRHPPAQQQSATTLVTPVTPATATIRPCVPTSVRRSDANYAYITL